MHKEHCQFRDEVVLKVSMAFSRILKTLFILRKWKYILEDKTVKNTVSSYLYSCEEPFWQAVLTSGSSVSSVEKARDIVRSIDERLGIRDLPRMELVRIFSSPEALRNQVRNRSDLSEGRGNNNGKKGQKSMVATEVSRSLKERSEDRKKDTAGNEKGLPRIGNRTRVYSSSLTREQFRDRISYWASHRDDLYER